VQASGGHVLSAGRAILTEVLDSYFDSPAPVPAPKRSAGNASLLAQLPAVDVTVRSRPLAEVLCPVYAALRDPADHS
jgi:hypothetical protein